MDYVLTVYRQDHRYKCQERMCGKYTYRGVNAKMMAAEVQDLSRTTHKPSEGWRLSVQPSAKEVSR
jgi:hypothetical protein